MRRAWITAIALMASAGTSSAEVEKGVFGLGLIIGEPTGVSAKYYLQDDHALDAAVGFSALGRGFHAHGDYLWHPAVLERKPAFILPFYVGVGGRVQDRNGGSSDTDHLRIGARLVIGLLFDLTQVPLDIFAEVAGVADFRTAGDSFGLDFNAGVGARYYF